MLSKTSIIAAAAIFLLALGLHIFQQKALPRPILIGNELSHVKLLHSTVVNKTFVIDPKHTDVSYHKGKYYSNKPPGYAFFLTPFYYLYLEISKNYSIKYTFFFMKLFNATLSSLSIAFIFLFLSTFKLSKSSIAFGLTAATFGTIFPVYSCLANSIPLSIFLFSVSILAHRLFRIKDNNLFFGSMALLAAVYAITVDYSNGFFLFPLVGLLLIKFIKLKKIALACLLVIFPLGLLFFYNYKAFDNPFILTYSHYYPALYIPWPGVGKTMSLTNIPQGIYGLLFSPSRGLFLLSPVTILGVIASWQLIRQKEWSLFLLAGMAFGGIFTISAYSLWHGGHSIGYRHILISAMILGMLSSFLVNKYKSGLRLAAIILLLFSSFTGITSFFIQMDQRLLMLTWKSEPASIHANFYTELLYPFLATTN